MKTLITTEVDEQGNVRNVINYEEIFSQSEGLDIPCEHYLGFLIKTLIDDFGNIFEESGANKEQFEAVFLDNLNLLITTETRLDEKDGK